MSLPASQALIRFVDDLLPNWVQNEADDLTRIRARLLMATVLGSIAFASISAVLYGLTDTRERALFNLGCVIASATVVALIRRTGRRPAPGEIGEATRPLPSLRPALDVLLGAMLLALLTGPMLSANAYQIHLALVILPFLAATIGGLRAGVVWTSIILVVLAVLNVAVWPDPVRGLVGWNAFIVASVVGVGGCIAEATREQARRDAEAAGREVSGLARSRDAAEAELRVNREIFLLAFRRAPAVLILSELATGRIVEVNECFERVSGWTIDEVRGRTLSELDAWVSPDDRERLAATIVAEGRTHDVEIFLRTKARREICLLAAADLLDLGNGRILILAQGIDITDRKRAEAALAASRKLLEARVFDGDLQLRASQHELSRQRQLASIGTLAAGIAHQINNPIASIMASAEFALLACQDEPANGLAIRDEALRAVVSEAARCGQIVKNVLRFARQQPTARWVEDLAPLVRRAATLCRTYVADHGGELEIEIADVRLPALVSPIEIEQVVVNLIRNAAEALEPGGRIHVRASRRGELVEIAVDDDGRGIEQELVDQLFEPFYTTRIQSGGTGLGLSFAHGVIVDHGGEIRAESEPGKGSRFRIVLPLASD